MHENCEAGDIDPTVWGTSVAHATTVWAFFYFEKLKPVWCVMHFMQVRVFAVDIFCAVKEFSEWSSFPPSLKD